MSKLSDYSKFDNLDENDSDGEDVNGNVNTTTTTSSSEQQSGNISMVQQQPTTTTKTTTGGGSSIQVDAHHSNRYYFQYNGQRIYDFQQELDQMTIFIKPPPHIQKGSQIRCEIAPRHLKVGLVGADQWYLNEDTFGTVDVDESTWSLEDDDDDDNNNNNGRKVLCIYLTKANRGTLWDAALKGNPNASHSGAATAAPSSSSEGVATLNPFHKEQVKKDLMIQRFQEENPGFDFRGADFNGSVPDPRSFMGGVKYD